MKDKPVRCRHYGAASGNEHSYKEQKNGRIHSEGGGPQQGTSAEVGRSQGNRDLVAPQKEVGKTKKGLRNCSPTEDRLGLFKSFYLS